MYIMKSVYSFMAILIMINIPCLGTTYTVTNTGNSGAGTLRQAISDANGNVGADIIAFNIPGAGVHTIIPTAVLPVITEAVLIDGSTQNTFTGASMNLRLIVINGSSLGTAPIIWLQNADNSTLNYLVISNGSDVGVQVESGSDDFVITGCYIGTNSTGTAAAANANVGLLIKNSQRAIVGGTGTNQYNLISGNINDGIIFENADNGVIIGNFVGTDITGMIAMPNSDDGVTLKDGSSGNTIGGTNSGERNIISGNIDVGIEIRASGTNNNQVLGNYIGVNSTGNSALPNGGHGIYMHTQTTGNTIGGISVASRNIISGNGNIGIFITGSGTNNQAIYGNYIGLAADGTTKIANAGGITIQNGPQGILIGGSGAGQGNTITGNTGNGVLITDNSALGTNFNFIVNNSIFCNGAKGINFTNDNANENQGILPPGISSSTANNISGTGTNGNTVHVYRNTTADGGAFCDCEGENMIGSTIIAGGVWSLTHNLGLSASQALSVTATQTNGSNSTSEFNVCSAPLPIALLNFQATRLDNGSVSFGWQTISEINADRFFVESSADNKNFNVLGQVPAQGNSNSIHQYNYLYHSSTHDEYFRLREVDLNGYETIFQVIYLETDQQKELKLYPNPFSDYLSIVSTVENQPVSILNIFGKTVWEGIVYENRLTLNTDFLSPGIYTIRAVKADGYFMEKIIKK